MNAYPFQMNIDEALLLAKGDEEALQRWYDNRRINVKNIVDIGAVCRRLTIDKDNVANYVKCDEEPYLTNFNISYYYGIGSVVSTMYCEHDGIWSEDGLIIELYRIWGNGSGLEARDRHNCIRYMHHEFIRTTFLPKGHRPENINIVTIQLKDDVISVKATHSDYPQFVTFEKTFTPKLKL